MISVLDEKVGSQVLTVRPSAHWIGVVEQYILRPEDQKIAYSAAMDRGKWARASWDAIYHGWEHWKTTGSPPHLPAKELAEAAAAAAAAA